MELIVFWLLLCGLIGWWAREWGRTWVAWFFVAFLLSPLIGGIALAIRGRRTTVQQVVAHYVPGQVQLPRADPATVIGALADLRDRGAITSEEYDTKKAELFARW